MSQPEEHQAVLAAIGSVERPTVVELGAYDGEDMIWIRNAYPDVRYIMVEADPRHAEMIRKYRDMRGITLIEAAIAGHTGECAFHLADNEIGYSKASSSIRRPKKHSEFFPWCTFDETIRVPCFSLSDLFSAQNIERADLVWADLQGAECDMISGGSEALKRTRYLFAEADEHEMYEGQATRTELLDMLPDWELVGTYECNVLLRNTQCD